MFAFIGGKKKPRKTLEAAVKAMMDGFSGETAIYNTETGEIFSLSGQPTILLTPSDYSTVKTVLGISALVSASKEMPFPYETVAGMIRRLSPKLAKDAVLEAANIYRGLRSKGGNSEPSGPDAQG